MGSTKVSAWKSNLNPDPVPEHVPDPEPTTGLCLAVEGGHQAWREAWYDFVATWLNALSGLNTLSGLNPGVKMLMFMVEAFDPGPNPNHGANPDPAPKDNP